jgi:hypothetical protein
MKSSIFWHMTPCSRLKVYRRFGGTCRLYLQGRRINQARNQRESKWRAEKTTRRYNPEDMTSIMPLKILKNLFIWTMYVYVCVCTWSTSKWERKSVYNNQQRFSRFVKSQPSKIIPKFIRPPSLALSSAHCCMSLPFCMVTAGTWIALQPLRMYTHNKLRNVSSPAPQHVY